MTAPSGRSAGSGAAPRGPEFTVVIPTYQRAGSIARAVGSVLGQTFGDFELIVCDDGSTDATAEVVGAMGDPRVRYTREPRAGVSAARNRGIRQARGRWVTFLDSDDQALPDWLATFHELAGSPDVGIVSGGARVVGRRGGRKVRETVVLPRPVGPHLGRATLATTAGNFAARRELLVEVGGYAEAIGFAENSELMMRLVPHCLAKGLRTAHVDRPLVVHHKDEDAWTAEPGRFALMRDAARYILDRHGETLRASFPRGFANYCGVAAVNEARLGQLAEARRHLAAAIRADPRRLTSYARWLATLVPPLARRLWTPAAADAAR